MNAFEHKISTFHGKNHGKIDMSLARWPLFREPRFEK